MFAGIGIATCMAVVFAFAYGFWVLYFRPLIADWRDGRKQR
jgi:hypothetical protein